MLQAAIYMAMMLAASWAILRFVAPTLVDKQQEQPVEIPTDESLPQRK